MTDPNEVSAELTRLRMEINQLLDMKQRVLSIQDKLTYISKLTIWNGQHHRKTWTMLGGMDCVSTSSRARPDQSYALKPEPYTPVSQTPSVC